MRRIPARNSLFKEEAKSLPLLHSHRSHAGRSLAPAEMVGRAKVAANKCHSGTRINPDGIQVAAEQFGIVFQQEHKICPHA